MIPQAITGLTRIIGKAQGYLGLPIRDDLMDEAVNGPGTPAMASAWLPNYAELARLNAGAPVIIKILGTQHPPIIVEVGEVPE